MAKVALFDLVVLGGGSAGYAAARTALSRGLKVAIIEGGPRLGGLCILKGCMPTKALLESSHRLHEIQRAREFGLKVSGAEADAAAVWRRKEFLIADFAGYRAGQLLKGKHTLLRGLAQFTGPHQLRVATVDDKGKPTGRTGAVQFRACIIATGSVVTEVPLAGLKRSDYLTSDEALELKKMPRSLAVLGGGVVAVEFAQHFARMGVKVTLLQRSERLLRCVDSEAAHVLEEALRRDGINVQCSTRWLGAERKKSTGKKKGAAWQIQYQHEGKKKSVAVEQILYALGRKPNTAPLKLEAAGISASENGAVKVNAQMQSSVPHIFAAGDVTALHDVVHIAIQQAEVAARNAATLLEAEDGVKAIFAAAGSANLMQTGVEKSGALASAAMKQAQAAAKLEKWESRLKMSVIFSEPQIAEVGSNIAELVEQEQPFFSASYPFADHGKSMIHGSTDGFVKLLCEPKRGELLGATFCGPHAGELIHEICVAMNYRGTAAELAAIPHYHPTLAEIITYPAEELAEKVTQMSGLT